MKLAVAPYSFVQTLSAPQAEAPSIPESSPESVDRFEYHSPSPHKPLGDRLVTSLGMALGGALVGGFSAAVGGQSLVNTPLIEGAILGTGGAGLGLVSGGLLDMFSGGHQGYTGRSILVGGGYGFTIGAAHGLATAAISQSLGGCALAGAAGGAIAGALAGFLLP